MPSVVSDGSAAFLIYANSHHASGCVWAARSDPALVDTNTNKVSQPALLCYCSSFSTTSMAATSRSNAPTSCISSLANKDQRVCCNRQDSTLMVRFLQLGTGQYVLCKIQTPTFRDSHTVIIRT